MAKIKIIEPFQYTDNGVSCCCMVLAYYGAKFSIVELKNEIDIGRDGIIWDDIRIIMSNHGLRTNMVDNSNVVNYLKNNKEKPIIARICNRYIVVEKVVDKTVYIADPLEGRYILELDIFIEVIDNNVMVLEPDNDFKKVNHAYYFWKFYLKDILKNKKLVVSVFLLSLISYVLSIVSPVIVQNIVDSVIKDNNKLINKYVIYFVIFVIISTGINLLKGQKLIGFRISIDKNISENAMKKLLFIPYKFYESRSNSEIMYGIGCCGTIREVFASQMLNGIIDFGAVFFLAFYIFKKNIYMGILTTVLFLANGLYIIFTNPKIIKANKGYINEQVAVNGMQIEAINTMQSIKMSAMELLTYNKWKSSFSLFQKKYKESQQIINIIDTVNFAIKTISPFIILLMSFRLYREGYLTIGETLAIQSLSNTFFGLASSLFTTIWGFSQSNIFMERMSDIISQKIENQDNKKKILINGNISLNNVYFGYKENGKKNLYNINLEIKQGEKIAIVGKSGSGKSSLAKVLVGLYKPTEGCIQYEGIDSIELDMSYVCSKIGIISQDASLFNKTIYDNIKMNREDITLDDVIQATKVVGIYDEICDMPLGYQTIASDFGGNFSGGQKQRIVLARAIVSKPKILVMDEATSALDNINEKRITQYLRDIGSTQIIIAHRFSSIVDADRIIVLDNGKIVGEGKHDFLLNNNEYYKELYYGDYGVENSNSSLIENEDVEKIRKESKFYTNIKRIDKGEKKYRKLTIAILLILSIGICYFLVENKINREAISRNEQNEKIYFHSNVIKEYVEKCFKEAGVQLTKENMIYINEIIIENEKITSLEDMKYFPNLQKLELKNTGINDITPLESLNKLKILKLNDNEIQNIDVIGKLYNLELIELSNNKIKTVGNLKNLTNLEYINLEGNSILDYGEIGDGVVIKEYKYNFDVLINFENSCTQLPSGIVIGGKQEAEKTYSLEDNQRFGCSVKTNNNILKIKFIYNRGDNYCFTRYINLEQYYNYKNLNIIIQDNGRKFEVKCYN